MDSEPNAEIVRVNDQRASKMENLEPPPGAGGFALIRLAVERSLPTDQLEKLMALHERWEANEARKAWVVALTACKAELQPTISKDGHVGFESKKGGASTDYDHTTLGNLVAVITPALARHGLSIHHTVDSQDEKTGRIVVSCWVTHAQGHRERVTLGAYPDESGNKNKIQAVGSALNYLRRYTTFAILGLASADEDDDGRGGKKPEPKETSENRALPERARKPIAAFEKLGIYQAHLEGAGGVDRKACDWEDAQYVELNSRYKAIMKLADKDRPAAARSAFGLPAEEREPGQEG